MLIVSHLGFIDGCENHALTLVVLYFHCEVVAAEDHILCRYCNRLTVLRLQEVVCRKHEESCLCLSLCRKRYVNSHLVSVEVCVKACADERMELDSTAFYEYRLECLDRKSVERRSTVEEDRMISDDLFQDIPNLRYSCVYLSSCCLDIELVVDLNELLDYEGLEEL